MMMTMTSGGGGAGADRLQPPMMGELSSIRLESIYEARCYD